MEKKQNEYTFDQIIEKNQDYANSTYEFNEFCLEIKDKKIININYPLENDKKLSHIDIFCKYAELINISETVSYQNKILRFKYLIPRLEKLLQSYITKEILADLAEKNIDFKTFDANANSSHYLEDEIQTIYKELDLLFKIYRNPKLTYIADDFCFELSSLPIKTQRIEELLNNLHKINEAGMYNTFEDSTTEDLD